MPTRYDVFLSHSSADKPAVEAIAKKLREAGIKPFLDKWHLIPGRVWQEELEKALEESRACAIFVGNEGLGPWAKQEMRVVLDRGAQEEDFPVIPVLLPGVRKPARLPAFLSQRTWIVFTAEIDDPGAFHRLVCGIRGEPPGPDGDFSPVPVRSMVPKPDGFIHRKEYDPVVEALCAENPHGSAVGITTALRGAGGFGKTALAQAVCQDERVQKKYQDGILLTTMGEEVSESGRLSRLRDLIRWWTESDPPVFERVETASAFLRELLAKRRVLLVVDDVWSDLDLIPFQGLSSALLITTREKDILPSGSQRIDVDAMAIPEAVNLLRAGLPEWDIAHFDSLARRLGEWPLLLTLVNRQLRELVEEDGLTVGESLQEVESILESEGLTGFDRENAGSRQSAVEKTLAVSLRRLNDLELACYRDLAVFPEDVEIPVSVPERFWGNSRAETEKLCRRLDNLSLLLRFDRRKGIIQLHDVVRNYLVRREGENLPKLHCRFLETLCPQSGLWKDLPETETYLWKHLGYHLQEAGERGVLRDLLLDFSFVQAKLRSTDVSALLADYDPYIKNDEELRLIWGALRLSSHVLAKNQDQLAPHLLGRLLGSGSSGIRDLLTQCQSWRAPLWLRPCSPCLTAPEGPLLRILEGRDYIGQVAVVDRRVVSASSAGTLQVWDLETGKILNILEGHTASVSALAGIDDRRAVSASEDGTLRVWDLESGQTLKILEGHTAEVRSVGVMAGGRRAVSASADRTLRVWDLASGQTLKTLEVHTRWVKLVAIVDGRRVVTASDAGTLRVWDLETGQTLKTLEGHTAEVSAVAVVDGRRAVSASEDGTLRIWDLETGQTLKVLEGHTDIVTSVTVLDGRRTVSASKDGTLRVWDLETGQMLNTLQGDRIHKVAAVDGRQAVSTSGDGRLRIWDLESGQPLQTPEGHIDRIKWVAVVEGGRRAVSASDDGTLRVWDLETGQALEALEQQPDWIASLAMKDELYAIEIGKILESFGAEADEVMSAAVISDQRAITGWLDGTLRVWDLKTGECLAVLALERLVSAVAVAPDGRKVVAGDESGRVHFLDLVESMEDQNSYGF